MPKTTNFEDVQNQKKSQFIFKWGVRGVDFFLRGAAAAAAAAAAATVAVALAAAKKLNWLVRVVGSPIL